MKLNKLLVIDVEATCWKTPHENINNEPSEIIEIGASLVDLTQLKIDKTVFFLVKPLRSKVSSFCTQLTTLTQEDVDQGTSLQEACSKLESQFNSKNITWGSYGDYDRNIFQRQCQELDVNFPFGKRHLNIKNLFAILNGLNSEVGMDKALQKINIKLEGTHHRGGDDSRNIAKILIHLAKRYRAA